MRVFILFCLLATTLAIPQGYNYQQQQNSFPVGSSQLSSESGSSAVQNELQEGHNLLQQSFQSPKLMQTLFGGNQQHSSLSGQQNFVQRPQYSFIPQSLLPHVQPQVQQQQHYQQQHHQQQHHIQPQHHLQQQQPIFQPQQYQQSYQPSQSVTKDIYVHVAPEEPEQSYVQQQIPIAPPRKHYRIVFIKAPTQKISSKNALRLQQGQSEEKTIIYVLTKKPDPIDLQTALQEVAPRQPSKPEVYFIKYKTQEEAQHAQRTIQAQYDRLGGTTQVSDEGVAPITSVIGSLDQPHINSGSGVSLSLGNVGSADFNSGNVASTYGVPLSGGSSASDLISSDISKENKYLPPNRV